MIRRRSQDESATATVTAEPAVRDPQSPKGRPTPKRVDARTQRRTAVAARPTDRKSAGRQQREARRVAMAKQREALAGGDPRHLPARDQGKVRKAVRDYVDARWHVAEMFLPFAVVIVVLSMLPNLQLKDISLILWLVLIVAIVAQTVWTMFALDRDMKRRFPNDDRRGIRWYGFMRTLQMRRMRMPKPQVKRGQKA